MVDLKESKSTKERFLLSKMGDEASAEGRKKEEDYKGCVGKET